jgi:dihydrofolate reductase
VVSQLTAAGLIDQFQLVVNPTILGQGRSLFETVGERLTLKLTKSQAFGNGNVVLTYVPA